MFSHLLSHFNEDDMYMMDVSEVDSVLDLYGKPVTLHKLKRNNATKTAWIRAISRQDRKPTGYTRIASKALGLLRYSRVCFLGRTSTWCIWKDHENALQVGIKLTASQSLGSYAKSHADDTSVGNGSSGSVGEQASPDKREISTYIQKIRNNNGRH
ncbi:hypothetical protein DPMN_075401 [Dreissena polymorpha]|uniref:Uncharacterized protein n=1 Tax=Dreissena polymorpha TaxID=45954 RepID=A0A9D4BEV8_DREPO|nr:hypothetical protein DPMN_075401 [Dreissena polymorpha]